MARLIDIVFDGPPGPGGGRLVEVEDERGRSVAIGEWIERANGLWALRIKAGEIESVSAEPPPARLRLVSPE